MHRFVYFLQSIDHAVPSLFTNVVLQFTDGVDVKEGLAAGIGTEDSDVVVYCLTANVSCPVLVKLEDNDTAQVK